MRTNQLTQYLDDPKSAGQWLRAMGLADLERSHANLTSIAEAGMTLDLMAVVCSRLAEQLSRLSDPDMALNNLDRFVRATRNPLSLGSLFDRDEQSLPILLQIFSTSQHLSDLLIAEPESYDLLRMTEGQPVARGVLVEDLCTEIRAIDDEPTVMTLLRRFKRREIMRVAYGDLVRGQRVDTVTRQISFVADAVCEAALVSATNRQQARYGVPRGPDGQPARLVVLALGKLGGVELNYSSDVDLMFLYDEDGKTDGEKSVRNQEFFDRVARGLVKLLTEPTQMGTAYRVDLRLRPEGSHGAMVLSRVAALHYYDVMGRTWERQAFVKARPVAGDLGLGREFLQELEPWIYRRYLSRADITGIKALKRRIEQRTRREQVDHRDVKSGHGGIRDVEFVIQFLQLLNGGDLPAIRTGNTLEAIAKLEQAGCLNMQERSILEENYAFLRKIEHRLQIMFDLQTHMLPDSEDELRKVAIRMGFAEQDDTPALQAFKTAYQQKTELNRKILDHLLHDAFGEQDEPQPEVDLVLDPEPCHDSIKSVLAPYGFRDVDAAYRNLTALAMERIPFLSTRRCRHFLAAIAPRLLQTIGDTPDPDATLVNLSQVSDSLGGKGVLWELFSYSHPSLQLYVRLCAASPYLSAILTSHPGMIDELMDSLVLDRLPTRADMRQMLAELCRGAEDIDPILHSFKNSLHLRVGVRDILGKEDIRATTAALADVAEVCLEQVTSREYQRMVEKYGYPRRVSAAADVGSSGDRASSTSRPASNGQNAATTDDDAPCELVILAMGKLGGREPNYHSDLDIIFLYAYDGTTRRSERGRQLQTTTNQHFFSELGQRIITAVSRLGPYGRLYELDPRLRPTGKSGSLAVSIAEFTRYFAEGQGQLWERQALCRARPVHGSPAARGAAMKAVHDVIVNYRRGPEDAQEIYQMRRRLQETASARNLKRGPGGTVDVEFTVQMLQLRHAVESPPLLVTGTLDAIEALHEAGYLNHGDFEFLSQSYRFLRSVEARLRLMNTTARHDLPTEPSELNKLAYLLGTTCESLIADCRRFTEGNRQVFERIFASENDV